MLKEFKQFALRGNVLDLAIGVIIGGAFAAIITSLVEDLLMPLIGLLLGGFDISALSLPLLDGKEWVYGKFIMAVVNFLIIAFALFLLVKAVNRFAKKPAEAPAKEARHCPYCLETVAEEAQRCPHCTSLLPEADVPAHASAYDTSSGQNFPM